MTSSDPKSKNGMEVDDGDDEEYEYEVIEVEEEVYDEEDEAEYEEIEIEEEVEVEEEEDDEEEEDEEVEYEEVEEDEEVEEEVEEVEYEEVEEEVEEEEDEDDDYEMYEDVDEEEEEEEVGIGDEPAIEAKGDGKNGYMNWIDQSSKGKWKGKKKPKKNPLAPKGVLNNFKVKKKKKTDQSDAECFFCKKKGHWKRNCKEYLATLKDTKQDPIAPKVVLNNSEGEKKKVDQSDAECFFCQKKGHWKRNCKVYLATLKNTKQDPIAPKVVSNNSEGEKKKVDKSDAECFFCQKKGHWKRNCKVYLATLKDAKLDLIAPKVVLNNSEGEKKKDDQSDAECFFCQKKGHWKRNCKEYLATLKDTKQDPIAPKVVLNNSKSVKKKVDQSDAECHFCKKKGHWKRNCREYLATLKDKKQGS